MKSPDPGVFTGEFYQGEGGGGEITIILSQIPSKK